MKEDVRKAEIIKTEQMIKHLQECLRILKQIVPDSVDVSGVFIDGPDLCKMPLNQNKTPIICPRVGGEYANRSFVLDSSLDWKIFEDSNGYLCLLPTHKK